MTTAIDAIAAERRMMVSRIAEANELLGAIEMFSPLNLARLVRRLDELINAIDTRLGNLEYRLDQASIKEPPDGIPDDECEKYFRLPLLGGSL